MRGPEGRIQDAVIKYARSKGLLCKKNEVGRYFVQAGWPDYMILGHHHIIFMEFKRPGGKLTALQDKALKEITGFGFSYYVIDDILKGKQAIDREFT